MQEENWIKIEDIDFIKELGYKFQGIYYEISSFGRFRSIKPTRYIPTQILTPQKGGRNLYYSFGYILNNEFERRSIPVSHLVAGAFLDYTPHNENEFKVGYVDGNRLNPKADNLEIITKEEYLRRNKRVSNAIPYKGVTGIGSDLDFDSVSRNIFTGVFYRELAKSWEVTLGLNYKILTFDDRGNISPVSIVGLGYYNDYTEALSTFVDVMGEIQNDEFNHDTFIIEKWGINVLALGQAGNQKDGDFVDENLKY